MWNPQHRPCTAEPEPAGLKGINPSDFGFGAVLLSWRIFHFSRALGTVSSPGTPEVRIYPSKAACGHRWGLQERTGMESSILPGCDPCAPGAGCCCSAGSSFLCRSPANPCRGKLLCFRLPKPLPAGINPPWLLLLPWGSSAGQEQGPERGLEQAQSSCGAAAAAALRGCR